VSSDGEDTPASHALASGLRRVLGRLGGPREPGRHNHISLGSHCHMAQVLKTLGLRTWSGPFDWIFSNPGMVRDCLADDFAALLDRTQLETVPLAERPVPSQGLCRHRTYSERYALPCVFNHHDPAANAAVYAFLREGVRRFRAARDNPAARNQFWLMTECPVPPATIHAICDALTQGRDGNVLTFLHVVPGRPEPRLADRMDAPNLRWLTVETATPSTGLRFADAADDRLVAALVEREAARATSL